MASCCIKGAFCLKKPLFLLQKRPFLRKKPPFRAWICTRGGGVSVFGCPRCLYLSISGGLVCVEALGSFLVSTFCPFRSYDTPLVSTFCRFLTYENGRRGGRLQTSTGRRTFRAFVLWCGCSFQYTAKPPHVGAFLSCVVHIVHVVHIWRRVWYSLNAAGRPLPENGQKSAKNRLNIAEI